MLVLKKVTYIPIKRKRVNGRQAGEHVYGFKRVKQGLVLYYLDAFPCYGEASNVRVWLSPNGKPNHDLRIVCIYKPETISFAWRNADEDALDARSTGILTCPVKGDRHFEIDISKCERGKDWKDM